MSNDSPSSAVSSVRPVGPGRVSAARVLGRVPVVLGIAAAVLAAAAVWLAFANPEIDNTSRGDAYACLAPWDTVLNGDDNYPPGEPPADGDRIAARCREAGEGRFETAVGFAIAAAIAGAAAAVIGRRRGDPRLPLS